MGTPFPEQTIQDIPLEIEDNRSKPNYVVDKNPNELPIFLYKDINGVPYSAKFFDIKEFNFLNEKILDINNFKEKAENIEDYVLTIIDNKGMNPDRKSYAYVVEEIISKIGKVPNENKKHLLDRVYNFVKIQNMLYNKNKATESLIAKLKNNK